MGVWGSGLYSGDFATDLRAAVRAVARLPFDGDKLAAMLSDCQRSAASNPEDEDYTTFWLVLADQFAKRGISSEQVRERALQIIDDRADLRMLERLGMSSGGLKKRERILTELRSRMHATQDSRRTGAMLKKPQPLLMDVGDILVYPTSRGHCINAYFQSKERIRDWKQDGWAAAVIVDVGRAFDFLAWYRPITVFAAFSAKPDMSGLHSVSPWVLKSAGTCSTVHFKRMELERIGSVSVDCIKLNSIVSNLKPGVYQAVNDISIANQLSVKPFGSTALAERPAGFRADARISKLDDICP